MKTRKKIYVCSECDAPVTKSGEGLGTFKCKSHPVRFVTVSRDTSGGKEADQGHRKDPVSVQRHTRVRIKYENEGKS